MGVLNCAAVRSSRLVRPWPNATVYLEKHFRVGGVTRAHHRQREYLFRLVDKEPGDRRADERVLGKISRHAAATTFSPRSVPMNVVTSSTKRTTIWRRECIVEHSVKR